MKMLQLNEINQVSGGVYETTVDLMISTAMVGATLAFLEVGTCFAPAPVAMVTAAISPAARVMTTLGAWATAVSYSIESRPELYKTFVNKCSEYGLC